MQKIVINNCYGGFSLSHAGCMRYLELAGKQVWPEGSEYERLIGPTYWLVPPDQRTKEIDWDKSSQEKRIAFNEATQNETFCCRDLKRDDLVLVKVVEELGSAADGRCAKLGVVEIPDGVKWVIEEYDGSEWIAEEHRTWS